MTTEQDRERARALAKILDRHLLAVRIAEALAAERERALEAAARVAEECGVAFQRAAYLNEPIPKASVADRIRALLAAGQPAEGAGDGR